MDWHCNLKQTYSKRPTKRKEGNTDSGQGNSQISWVLSAKQVLNNSIFAVFHNKGDTVFGANT